MPEAFEVGEDGAEFAGGDEGAGDVGVAFAQFVDDGRVVAGALERGVDGVDEPVRDAPEGGHDDDALGVLGALGDQVGDPADALGGGDRGPAELEHVQGTTRRHGAWCGVRAWGESSGTRWRVRIHARPKGTQDSPPRSGRG